jgi:hypothetical protein
LAELTHDLVFGNVVLSEQGFELAHCLLQATQFPLQVLATGWKVVAYRLAMPRDGHRHGRIQVLSEILTKLAHADAH